MAARDNGYSGGGDDDDDDQKKNDEDSGRGDLKMMGSGKPPICEVVWVKHFASKCKTVIVLESCADFLQGGTSYRSSIKGDGGKESYSGYHPKPEYATSTAEKNWHKKHPECHPMGGKGDEQPYMKNRR